MSQTVVLVGIIMGSILLFGVFCVAIVALVMIRRLQGSFNKLGYMVREDAKKYFDDASNKLVETNLKFREEYEQIVTEGTQTALVDTGVVMERSIAEAQKEAGKIILEAQKTAQNIVVASREEAKKHFYQVIDRSVDAIDWTMKQYVGQTFGADEHQEIIRSLLRAYIDERKQ